MLFLTACAGWTQAQTSDDKASLPPLAASCRKVTPPAAIKGGSLEAFALQNRAALNEANSRIESCGEFYESVRREFGE